MVLLFLIFMPITAAVVSLAVRHDKIRRLILVLAAAAHTAVTASLWINRPAPAWSGTVALDPLGLLFLSITSVLFLAAAFYAKGYLGREEKGHRKDFQEGLIFSNAPEAVFIACLLFFLGAMSSVTLFQHFGLIWVGVEATTLASAPLIYFHRHKRSLEATWKYLMICSVGIALALMGYLLLAISATDDSGGSLPMVISDLVKNGASLRVTWLKAAFILFMVGYGTKMGLAPLHTWLPDAHSEAPSVVSMLLSGALLNCAFLGILRALQVCAAAGQAEFARDMMTVLGFFSMLVAAVFILGQTDYKRMLAYSSVEHMGILAVGIGLGGAAAFGSMLHAVNHSLTKGMLFLLAGNILALYKTKSSNEVKGVLKALPVTGALWLLGFLAITGSPPFGPFLSEFTILKGALGDGHYFLAGLYLFLLAVIFIGMSVVFLKMAQGAAPASEDPGGVREGASSILPPAALAVAVTVLGVYVPAPLQEVLTQASKALGI